jgi:hypothetical protein
LVSPATAGDQSDSIETDSIAAETFDNVEKARLSWFLLVSITAHTICLWQWNLAYLYWHSLGPFKIDLHGSASLQEGTIVSDIPVRAPGPARATFSQAPARATQGLSGKASSSGSEISASSESNTADGAEGIVSSAGGIALGTEGGFSTSPGKSSGGGSTSSGGGKTSALPGTSAATGGAKPSPMEKATPSIDTILPKRTHPIHGDVYFDVDTYVLEGVNITATNLCIDGEQLRTNEPIAITESVTDRSLCRVRTRGDEEREFCPPAATKTVIRYAGHLRAPLSYAHNVCLAYDKSNCRIINGGTDKEREICRPVHYEGVWAVGTIFDYRCQLSEVRTYHHPIEFTVRHLVDFETSDGKYRRKELRRVRHPIPQCR